MPIDIDLSFINGYKENMRVVFFKIVSIIFLVVVVSIFTGLPESVSATLFEKGEKSCCDECDKNEEQSPGTNHCSTPGCPLFVCLAINIDSPLILSVSFESIYTPLPNTEPILKLLPKSIFHPPRLT
jgi:hypothetical protein